MRSNFDVIEAFLDHMDLGSLNLVSKEGKLFSYDTCIAEWDGDIILYNGTYYSQTTSKHVGILKRLGQDLPMECILNIPIGTQQLI